MKKNFIISFSLLALTVFFLMEQSSLAKDYDYGTPQIGLGTKPSSKERI